MIGKESSYHFHRPAVASHSALCLPRLVLRGEGEDRGRGQEGESERERERKEEGRGGEWALRVGGRQGLATES